MKSRLLDQFFVEWKFHDGTSQLPLEEVWRQYVFESSAMAASEDPGLRLRGRERLRELARIAASMEAQLLFSTAKGAKGGSASKRRKWAEQTAERLAKVTGNATDDQAWINLPDPDEAWSFETNETDFEVYVDGDRLVAVDQNTGKEIGSLTRSSFLKSYYRKFRSPGK